MADLNVQTTIGSPIEWYKIEVMRDVVNVKEAFEAYSKQDAQGFPVDTAVVRARMQSLLNSLVAYLKRKWKPEAFEKARKIIYDDTAPSLKELRDVFWDVQIQLDKDNITKMDTRRSYDGTRAEEENTAFGE